MAGYGPSDWWWNGCVANIQKDGGVMCPEQHCNSKIFKNYSENFCNCTNSMTQKYIVDGKCTLDATTDVPILSENCYCCCGCFANETLVAEDSMHYKAIEDFRIGDLVYAADDASLASWSQKIVRFSAGTGNFAAQSTLIKVNYGNEGKENYLLVNRPQLFLMPDKKLKAAAKLVPGRDQLVLYDGSTVPVNSLEVGQYKKGLHHIATSSEPAKNMDGHLILAKGVVCGDYALQQAMTYTESVKALLVEGHEALPEFGTKEYIQTHSHLVANTFRSALSEAEAVKLPKEVFEPHGLKGAVSTPEHVHYFISKAQAWDIEQKGHAAPPASAAGRDMIHYLFTIFKGFYPDVVFYVDNENESPNAYSFIEYGTPIVIVNGGLLRHVAIKFEALALVIAHELGHLNGGAPLNEAGYSCEGQADYVAVYGILPQVFYGLRAIPIIKAGVEQIKEFFDDILPDNRKGKAGSKCMDVGIDCRLSVMEAAFTMLPLPECAGGPPDPALEVEGATATKEASEISVTVSFNIPVDPETAEALGNYAFNPKVKAYSAEVDPSDPTSVVIKADIEEGIQYELLVKEVLSIEQQPLVTGKNEATFELEASAAK